MVMLSIVINIVEIVLNFLCLTEFFIAVSIDNVREIVTILGIGR